MPVIGLGKKRVIHFWPMRHEKTSRRFWEGLSLMIRYGCCGWGIAAKGVIPALLALPEGRHQTPVGITPGKLNVRGLGPV